MSGPESGLEAMRFLEHGVPEDGHWGGYLTRDQRHKSDRSICSCLRRRDDYYLEGRSLPLDFL